MLGSSLLLARPMLFCSLVSPSPLRGLSQPPTNADGALSLCQFHASLAGPSFHVLSPSFHPRCPNSFLAWCRQLLLEAAWLIAPRFLSYTIILQTGKLTLREVKGQSRIRT